MEHRSFKRLHTYYSSEHAASWCRIGSLDQNLRDGVEEGRFKSMVHTMIKLPFGTWPQENALVRSCNGLVSLSSMVEHSREHGLGSFRHGSSDTSTKNGWVEAVHVFLG